MRFISRNIVLILTLLTGMLVLKDIHSVVTPFLLGAILAYLLSPLVRVCRRYLRLPRILAILFVYIAVLGILFFFFTQISILLADEYNELNKEIATMTATSFVDSTGIPPWGRELVLGILQSIRPENIFAPERFWPYFSGALSRIESVFIFLIATFYFLKDGHVVVGYFTKMIFGKQKEHLRVLQGRIYDTLNNYLRGQVFLVFLMGILSWLTLSLLHVKYALILGIFTGIAETIPIIGPLSAGTVAVVVAMFDGVHTLSLPPILEGILIASIYLVYRQFEDIFVIPYVLGKATKLHPLVILFSVLVGGHIWGVLGMIFAIPVAALVRVVLEYLDQG